MSEHARSFQGLAAAFRSLPGIGPKSAERLAYHLVKSPPEVAETLVHAILQARERVRSCSTCFTLTEQDPCPICADPTRDQGLICVVEQPGEIFAVERTRNFKGVYHVLLGALSPLDGIGPGELKIQALVSRVEAGGVREIIVATNPKTEGEATATYLADLLKPKGVAVTRLAYGLPMGGELEYADEMTLTHSLSGRRAL